MVPEARTASAAAAASTASATAGAIAAAVGPGRVEVCGDGPVSEAEAARAARDARRFRVSPQVSERFLTSLKSSDDDAVRALGIHLDGWIAAARARKPFQARAAACGGERACERESMRASRAAVEAALGPARQALIRLASTTRDPAAYAIAWQQVCQVGIGDAQAQRDPCTALSVERWAQIDPDNVVPWLYLAFANRKDEAAAADALFRASVARTVSNPGASVLARAASAIEREADQTDRLRLGTELAGVEAAWPNPPYATALNLCGAGKVHDANRRQLCDAFAATLVDRASTLTDRAVGTRIGELAGWDKDRIAALRIERDGLTAALASRSKPDFSSCAAWKRDVDGALRRSRLGELAYARELALATGKSLAELAAPTAEARRRRLLAASSAAPAGSAAATPAR